MVFRIRAEEDGSFSGVWGMPDKELATVEGFATHETAQTFIQGFLVLMTKAFPGRAN